MKNDAKSHSRLLIERDDLRAQLLACREASGQVAALKTCGEMIERFPEGIVLHDSDGKILFVNKAFCDDIGFSEAELLSMRMADIDVAAEAYRSRVASWQAIEYGSSVQIDTKYRRKDGTVFPVEVYITPILLNYKKRFMAVGRDTMERKAWAFALHNSEAQLSNAVKIAKIGHWEYDVATDFFRFNDHFYAIFRTTAEEVGGYEMTPADYAIRFLHPDDRFLVEEETRKAIESDDPGYTRQLEHRIIYADGEPGYLSVRIFIVKDENGRTVKSFGANQDITERKRREKEQRKLEMQLLRSRRLETIGTLAGGIAHDFNNILTPILGYAEMALSSLSNSDSLFVDFQEIRTATVRAKDLISQMLTFSQQLERERRPIDVSVVVGEALRLLRPTLPSDIEIRQIIDPNCGEVLADSVEIHQVVVNLCNNAVQAMTNKGMGGTITFELSSVLVDENLAKYHSNLEIGPYVRLSATDTGEGMDEETLDRIFEPFFTTRDVDKGNGMGLSVVHGIIRSHRGDIAVSSEKGVGSTFHIYLPQIITSFDNT